MIRRTKGFYCPAPGCRLSNKPFTSSTSLKKHQDACPAQKLFVLRSHEALLQRIQTRELRLEEERREAQAQLEHEVQDVEADNTVRYTTFIFPIINLTVSIAIPPTR